MSVYTYKELVSKAKTCRNNVKKHYKLEMTDKWSYYFAKAILKPHTDIKRIEFGDNPKPQQDKISRQASKTEYMKLAKELVEFVEKKKRLPNYIKFHGKKVSPRLLTYDFAKVLDKYNTNKKFQEEVIISSKVFTKPTETGNVVYDYACKKYGKNFKTLDEILSYVASRFTYQYYYDDHKSNKEVTDSKSGNCTDLLQWLINMVTALGYDWKCIHVKCRSSGGGHVYGKFRHKKHTGNEWIVRDIAAVASGKNIHNVWCRDGILQAENPSWFMENLHR